MIAQSSASVRPRGTEKDYPYGQIAKDASAMKGLRVTDVSCIFQFDGITGPKQFLADYSDASGLSSNIYDARLNRPGYSGGSFDWFSHAALARDWSA